MTNIVKFADYRKIKFTTLKYYDYLMENYPNILLSLQYNDIDRIVNDIQVAQDPLAYHACLGYACYETNIELFNELAILDQNIDLKIVYHSIFGNDTYYDLFEACMIAYDANMITPAFFAKLNNDDLNISFSNLKNKEFKIDKEHSIFHYPEYLLHLTKNSINLSDILLMTNEEDEPVATRALDLPDKETIYKIFDLIKGKEKNECFLYLLNSTFDEEISEYLIKDIQFYDEKGELHEYVDAQYLFSLNEHAFKQTLERIDYTKKDVYERGFSDSYTFATITSKIGDENTNLNSVVKHLADKLKNNEKFTFHKDSNNISLLHYLLTNQRVFQKYIDKIDFSDPYVQKEIDAIGYKPVIEQCQPLYIKQNKLTQVE